MHENPNFNLPDGCSVNDIPGNHPEDTAREQYVEEHFLDPEFVGVYLLEQASTELGNLTPRRTAFIADMFKLDPKYMDIVAHGLGENYLLWLEEMWEGDEYERPEGS
jgi:hypothetical protein